MTREVTFLLYDGFAATDAVGPADVFTAANDVARASHYRTRYVSPNGRVTATNGMRLETALLEDAGEVDMLMIPGAEREPLRRLFRTPEVLPWVVRVAERAERVCSVCSGAFVLAAAGLLDGRRATTHWRGLERLAAAFPKILLERQALYVEDGKFWTSAGVTSGVDMALALVERDHGRPLAMAVAREMVLFLVRPGGQAQFSAPLDLQEKAANSELSALPYWLESRLAEGVSVAAMAGAMSMSERNFHRRCVAAFGMTPNALLQRLRLERARLLLEHGSLALKDVAVQSGLGDVSAMGKLFRQHLGVTPGDYRAHFAGELTAG